MKTCEDCAKPLWKGNTSGYCQTCYHKHAWDHARKNPEFEAKRTAGIRRGLQCNPERKERYRETIRRNSELPQSREARSRKAKEIRLWELGHRHITAESRRRGAKRQSDTKLAWCPPELRDEYRALCRRTKLPAAEVREIILRQHEADMARFRQQIGGQS